MGDTVAARAAGAMVRIFACPRRVAFQPHADEPAFAPGRPGLWATPRLPWA